MQFTPLTPDQRRQFDDEGYLIVRNALDLQTVTTLIEAGDRLLASPSTENRSTSDGGRFDGFRNAIALDDAFVPLLTWPTTVPLVAQLFGPHIHLVTSHLIAKAPDPPEVPDDHREPGWHRDVAGTNEDLGYANCPRLEMKVAYNLTDLSEPSSGVTLFSPGSNHLKEPMRLPPGRPDPDNAVEPLLQPGDAVLFENRTWHAGGPNRSGRTRKAVMFGYGYQWLKPFDYLTPPERLAAMLDPIGQQMLGLLTHPEGRFVPGGIDTPLREWCREHGV